MHRIPQQEGWGPPRGYPNGVEARFISGRIGWVAQGRFETEELVVQTRQVSINVL
ncbi:MAG TPA: hypothetical protein PLN31_12480 [Azoarcus taiwanensis]|nr:hypothetical protein [Azoarcus taiwanensis]